MDQSKNTTSTKLFRNSNSKATYHNSHFTLSSPRHLLSYVPAELPRKLTNPSQIKFSFSCRRRYSRSIFRSAQHFRQIWISSTYPLSVSRGLCRQRSFLCVGHNFGAGNEDQLSQAFAFAEG